MNDPPLLPHDLNLTSSLPATSTSLPCINKIKLKTVFINKLMLSFSLLRQGNLQLDKQRVHLLEELIIMKRTMSFVFWPESLLLW